ncbi:helix-turn-helix domain-containing protein [Streptomyces sp. NPDC056061]|uniref:helix-turn-helix domain-containing protein n=1 Tax=Streptomyces sp. NPDC056061 TaxID=3345700 RepID=UPI0035D97B8E
MYRLARTGGSRELLRWLSGRSAGWAALLDADGGVLQGVTRAPDDDGARTPVGQDRGPTPRPETAAPTSATGTAAWAAQAAALASEGVQELATLGARSFSFDRGPHTVLLFPLTGRPDLPAPVLAVVAPRPLPDGLATLLSDVAMPLAMCWTAETVERRRRRVDLAESRTREAVLHLLMTGQMSIAHQVAGALGPELPDPVRVCVVECPVGRRDEVARVCAEISGGRSWIVRCPVYARHLILIVPAGPASADPPVGRRVADVVDECVVGASEDVPLADTATGYRQAFHALAVARRVPTRHTAFGSAPEAALVVGTAGAQWADTLLNALLTHVPRRSHDPGGQELMVTLASWLSFSSHATQHLKIHRNTLAARLRLIGDLLGLDLNRLADQAALDLALRIRATPLASRAPGIPHREAEQEPGGTAPARPYRLDDILRVPAAQEWAAHQLRPLDDPGASGNAADPHTTLRTWLDCEAQLSRTAEVLGISVPGVRKRLTRLESLLQRSLLQAPSARYDLWLAFRTLDVAKESPAP